MTKLEVDASEASDPRTIKVTMWFAENEFFTNESLATTVRFKEDREDEVAEVQGCSIEWKEGKDLTIKKIKKK